MTTAPVQAEHPTSNHALAFVQELAVELNQLRAAAEVALGSHDFDREPMDFFTLLRSQKA